jgi:hypothetical protein
MLFETIEELLDFFNDNAELFESVLKKAKESSQDEIEEKDKTKCVCADDCDCGCDGKCTDGCGCTCNPVTESESKDIDIFSKSVIIESLSNNPELDLVESPSGEDIFYVLDFAATPNSCGTGSISLQDRITHMNMCESDGVSTVTLSIIVEGKRLPDIPFILKKANHCHPCIHLNKKHLM